MAQHDPTQNPFQASSATPYSAPTGEGDATGGVIPYKNMYALVSYYLGVFSLIPCVGFPLGVTAVVLGIIGLKKRNANPVIKGTAHAWVGIILGGLCAIAWGAAIVLMLVGAMMNSRR